jgi:hypothetical protein
MHNHCVCSYFGTFTESLQSIPCTFWTGGINGFGRSAFRVAQSSGQVWVQNGACSERTLPRIFQLGGRAVICPQNNDRLKSDWTEQRARLRVLARQDATEGTAGWRFRRRMPFLLTRRNSQNDPPILRSSIRFDPHQIADWLEMKSTPAHSVRTRRQNESIARA